MQLTLQYFSKTEDRELDMLLRAAMGSAGFTFVSKVLDKGGGSIDYTFDNPDLAKPDEPIACIDCILGTFKSRADSKGRCLVCQQQVVDKVSVDPKDGDNLQEKGILKNMVDANVGDLITFAYGSARGEDIDIAVRKISSRIVSEKPVTEKELRNNTDNLDTPGRSGRDVDI